VIASGSYAQTKNITDTIPFLSLDQCIAYGLQYQPGIRQSTIQIAIAKKTNEINLSGWLPQASANASLTHYIQLPVTYEVNPSDPNAPPIPVKNGIYNTFTPQLAVTENIFSPELLYSAKNAPLLVKQARQGNDSAKINVVATISTAFFNLLNTIEQINVLKEDTVQFYKTLEDAYHQYVGGIVDKTDYEQATITLNNSKAQLRQAIENVKPQYASLKQVMGFPPEKNFNILVDTAKMMNEIAFDTTQQFQYENRIEYQLLETAKKIQEQNIDYYRFRFLPTVSAFYTYNDEYESNTFSDLLSRGNPFSFIGASLSIPLFTGFGRLESVQRAKLQWQIINLSEVNLVSGIYTQYYSALANYKSNLYNLNLLRVNKSMASDVYDVVTLQYRQGIIPYLNVISAQNNLVASEISYINSLFQVLLSKIDLEKALGDITTKQ
ncbi:MAG TPA: TolC family protein, partial [Bacteroidia bacterium]|nr:TolC family protein [Bacteroidia bacterium]